MIWGGGGEFDQSSIQATSGDSRLQEVVDPSQEDSGLGDGELMFYADF